MEVLAEVSGLRLWRISLLTSFPKAIVSDVSQGLPQELKWGNRIGQSGSTTDGIKVALLPDWGALAGPPLPPTQDAARLLLEVEAIDLMAAMQRAESIIDLVMDDLSFQLQEPLNITTVSLLDITPPLAVGEKRTTAQYTSYDQYKLNRSIAMGTTSTETVVGLRTNYANLDRRSRDALDWYIKALHAPWDADKYIFFWVCFEVS